MSRTFLSNFQGCLSSLIPFLTSHPSLSPQLRKTEGKAPATGSTELPPEYLTSPLSQQSQVNIFTSTLDNRVSLVLSCSFRVSNSAYLLLLICSCLSSHVFDDQMPPKRDEAALQEEEELQLAIALSQSEADEKERMVSCTDKI